MESMSVKRAVGEEDGQGHAGEAAAGAHVEHLAHRGKRHGFGDSQRVEHMMLVEMIHVFARDDVDMRIPFLVQRQQSGKLLTLPLCQFREIF